MLIKCNPLRTVAAESLIVVVLCLGSDVKTLASPIAPDIPDIQGTTDQRRVGKELALGRAYLTGDGAPQDLHQAAYWYEKAAGLGDPLAQNEIGYFYQVGIGVPVDPVRAVHWYQLSASNGLTSAKVNLAVTYIRGIGVQKSPKTGEKLLMEAANKGNGIAATYLGDMHLLGVGMPRDEAAAEKWYEKSAKMHSYLGNFRMGMILSDPNRHPQDLKRALSLLRASASAGFVPAKHAAGLLLVNHPDICTSHDEALTLLNKAANAGMWKSSVVLGALARDGKWVPRDSRQAYLHFRAGELQGGEAASAVVKNDLQALSVKLSAKERMRLDEEASGWAQEHSHLLAMVYKGHNKKLLGPTVAALADPESGSHAGLLVPLAAF